MSAPKEAAAPEETDSGHDPRFRFIHAVAVRFRDVDVAGHAHHAQALIYFEEARWAYWTEVVGKAPDEVDYVLADARVRWHARVLWPQVVRVGLRVSRVGRKHFEMEYEVRSEDGERVQSGSTVQVMYDYERGASKLLDADLRAILEGFDGPFP